MAIATGTMTITITESLDVGTTVMDTATSVAEEVTVNDIYKRVITVPTSEITLYNTHGSVPQGSTFDNNAVKYVRITNYDTSNYIHLRISNQEGDEFVYRLANGQSFILWGHLTCMNASQGAALTLGTGESSIADVTAQSNNGACDVEIVVAS